MGEPEINRHEPRHVAAALTDLGQQQLVEVLDVHTGALDRGGHHRFGQLGRVEVRQRALARRTDRRSRSGHNRRAWCRYAHESSCCLVQRLSRYSYIIEID